MFHGKLEKHIYSSRKSSKINKYTVFSCHLIYGFRHFCKISNQNGIGQRVSPIQLPPIPQTNPQMELKPCHVNRHLLIDRYSRFYMFFDIICCGTQIQCPVPFIDFTYAKWMYLIGLHTQKNQNSFKMKYT